MPSTKDQIVLLLVKGLSDSQVSQIAAQQPDADLEAIPSLIAEARAEIALAGTYSRNAQRGIAIRRLELVITNASTQKPPDNKTILAAQTQLSRLMDLYAPEVGPSEAGPESSEDLRRTLKQIEEYLMPLGIADAGHPIEEHARQAAEIIRTHGWAGVKTLTAR